MDLKFSKVTRKGPVTIVTLSRPEVYNALHTDAHFELNKVFDDFSADPEQWVAIVTGAGDKAFCAGNDLKWQAAGGKRGWDKGGFAGLTSRFDWMASRGWRNRSASMRDRLIRSSTIRSMRLASPRITAPNRRRVSSSTSPSSARSRNSRRWWPAACAARDWHWRRNRPACVRPRGRRAVDQADKLLALLSGRTFSSHGRSAPPMPTSSRSPPVFRHDMVQGIGMTEWRNGRRCLRSAGQAGRGPRYWRRACATPAMIKLGSSSTSISARARSSGKRHASPLAQPRGGRARPCWSVAFAAAVADDCARCR